MFAYDRSYSPTDAQMEAVGALARSGNMGHFNALKELRAQRFATPVASLREKIDGELRTIYEAAESNARAVNLI